MVIISDTSPIANLIQINRLKILEELFHSVIIPPKVHAEIIKLEELNYRIENYKKASWIKVLEPSDKNKVEALNKKIDLVVCQS